MSDLTHKKLCALAVDWLKRPNSRSGPGCQVAISETKNYLSREIPDAIGWRALSYAGSGSVIVEAKISRSDFIADKKKPHRCNPAHGMGAYRYYIAPEGVILPDDLPSKWGLIEVNRRGHLKVICGHVLSKRSEPDLWRHDEYNIQAEVSMLALALARVGDPQAIQDRLRESNNQLSRMIRENQALSIRNRELVADVCRLKNGDQPLKAIARKANGEISCSQ